MAFTVADVIEQVRALAAERPEFVYRSTSTDDGDHPSCSYVTGADGQGCIIGQALMRLGVEEERLADLEDSIPGGMGADTLLFRLLGRGYAEGEMWISAVQASQDTGIPWGKAVKIADERHGRL